MEALDVRVLRSVPTPMADGLVARGCRTAGDVLAKPEALQDVMHQLHVANVDQKATAMLGACRKEASDAWGSADSAFDLLRQAEAAPPIGLPCSLGPLLGSALRPGGAILEVCGLPGTGKTQFCLQLCAAAQLEPFFVPSVASRINRGAAAVAEAVYIDTEGSFVAARYAQVCRALISEHMPAACGPEACHSALETALRGMHVCRTYDAAELYATVKHLKAFLKLHPNVRTLILDSVAFCFRHEFMDDVAQRARVLTDIAATLRRYGAEHGLVVVVVNHMTTRFDRNAGENDLGWIAPALGETWAHQPSTQLRLERTQLGPSPLQPVGRATLTKSVDQAAGATRLFRITESGIRDASAACTR
eukprot:gnl/TRDRNA2_/TRDRNA2_182776_c0_seq1.p1 gnl/TRDRNA2_/TRDRNA2_182776_c0~~gnl/TRDRNA2_/TRDRNA2_182776_c0_seq1.p1  ORF type:complete len:362 (-),score=61.33 gnl/TRDRNA2_/TRDRNA2_182776_c0_seq1:87-1172(-)